MTASVPQKLYIVLQIGRSFWQESGGKMIDLDRLLAGQDGSDGIFWCSGADLQINVPAPQGRRIYPP